jgi:hypothetical protein
MGIRIAQLRIRAVPATAVATFSSPQKKIGSENHEPTLPIEINAFNQLHWD